MPLRPSAVLLALAALPLSLSCKDEGDDSGDPGDGGALDGGTDAPVEVTVSLEATLVDECREVCGSVAATGPAAGLPFLVESDLDGFLVSDGVLDEAGQGSFCLRGLSPGVHTLAVHVDPGARQWQELTLEVRPFGWDWGLDRPVQPLDAPPWVPDIPPAQMLAEPVLGYQEGAWDSLSVLAPSTVTWGDARLLYYAGTEETEFRLGVATSVEGGAFQRYAGNPILTAEETGAVEGDWDYYAQNTPEVLVRGEELWLYYNGRGGTDGGLNIGLATSTDGYVFSRIEQNPVLAPTGVEDDFDGAGVAHPSVVVRQVDFTDNDRGATEVFELWYASGSLQIGYALSADGRSFERYCRGPVFSGVPGSWDRMTVKAPEVVYEDGRYYMTYSGCGQGCYQVGWAASDDGVRWAAHDAPIIPAQEAPAWNSYGTQEAFIEVEGDTWRFWYAGTGESHGQVGVVETVREPEEG
ncbi:hypothetical protein L6R53_20275 [Myxococcota bacterium]|nr:hypothetical protein [Myxococcota bacterium]